MTARVLRHEQLCRDDALRQLYAEHGPAAPADFEGLLAWSDALGKPLTAVVIDGPGGYDAAVLVSVSAGRMARSVQIAGHGWVDLQAVPARSAAASTELVQELLSWLQTLGRWRFAAEQLPVDDPFLVALVGRAAHVRWRPGDPTPYVQWPSERTENSWARKKFRQQFRQSLRRLQSAHSDPAFVQLSQPHEIAARFSAYDELFIQRERAIGRPARLENSPVARLKHETILRLAQAGRISCWELRIGPELLAYYVAVRDGATWRMWDGRMSPNWTKFVPGTVLMAHLLQTWHADPQVERVDFMRGMTELKRRVCSDIQATGTIRAWSDSGVQRTDIVRETLSSRARAGVRSMRERSVLARRFAATVQGRRAVR